MRARPQGGCFVVKSSSLSLNPCSKRPTIPENHKANKVSPLIASDDFREVSSLSGGKEKIKESEGSRKKSYPIHYVVDGGWKYPKQKKDK